MFTGSDGHLRLVDFGLSKVAFESKQVVPDITGSGKKIRRMSSGDNSGGGGIGGGVGSKVLLLMQKIMPLKVCFLSLFVDLWVHS